MVKKNRKEFLIMVHLGIDVPVKNIPSLDPGFLPLGRFNEAFLQTARKPFHIAVERAGGQMAACHTFIHGTPERFEADVYYIERTVKTLLWMKGGFRVYLAGDEAVCGAISGIYSDGGQQDFDVHFMENVFEHPFEVLRVETVPEENHDYARRRVLWRLYHYERLNGDESTDVFPAITYDRRKDGYRKFSFLWRLFRYERDPEKGTSLDVLFLPLRRP